MSYKTTIRARYSETDQMGIIYHANYFNWFEVGRTEFFKNLGYSYKQLEELGILLPVIDVGCKYKISAKYDDEVIIETWIDKMKGVRIEFNYNIIRKSDNALLAEGHTIHAFVDKDLKPVNFKKKYNDLWSKLYETME
ncbi:acyl-CoA thioesterase [Clostridium sp. D2Q-11]|uniref:Acyl-CoA thioesterase n=1 Tax=Anaeromonas frigoriresistens TaxID=2683708 RepID=A0A942UV62_9FIRM|nr:thioesterase family protein [Anaeromonas frigoriresistens]MBS4537394.1 acyl-CoA thioesterase [Anaeromonas frigoriresistens]